MKRLEGKVAVITGGSSGIGLASAQAFATEGAKVVLFGRQAAKLEAASSTLAGDVLTVAGDMATMADLDQLVEATHERFGKVDVLFLNAGIAEFSPVESVDTAFFDHTFGVNVRGKYFAVQKFLPYLKNPSSVIMTASSLMHRPLVESSIWAAGMAAVRSFVQSLPIDLAGRGIRFNVISPGPTDTPIYDGYGMPPEAVTELKAGLAEKTLFKRMATPEDIARTALFLASDDSRYMTGAELVVDGGYCLA